jgi:hypothetical protein
MSRQARVAVRRLRMSPALALFLASVALGAQALGGEGAKPALAKAPVAKSVAVRAKAPHRSCRRTSARGQRGTKRSASRRRVCVTANATKHGRRKTPPNRKPSPRPARPAPPASSSASQFSAAPQPYGPAQTSGSNAPASGSTAPSAWNEPALVDPTIITLSTTNYDLALPQNKDYILRCPNGPIDLPSTLSVWGGHNVVIQHCDFEVNDDWVAYLHNTAGTLWVDDVHFGGTNLTGGVQLQEPGATVVMRDVLFDTVYGSYSTNHAELIQTWAGPSRFLIDGLTGSTTYQGLYLLPNQWYTGPAPTLWDLRNIDIDDTEGAYALWVSDQNGAFPLDVQNVYVVPDNPWRGWWLWGFAGQDSNTPGQGTWANVTAGAPPGGPFVQPVPGGATGVDDEDSPPALPGEQP